MATFNTYKTIAEINNERALDQELNFSRTRELDRLMQSIFRSLRAGAQNDTLNRRVAALAAYLGAERLRFTEGAAGIVPIDVTYNGTLILAGETQFDSVGRFTRTLKQCVSAALAHNPNNVRASAMQIWLNNASLEMNDETGQIPPVVPAFSWYNIDSGPMIVNDGSVIELEDGDTIRMWTTAIAYSSQIWQLDTVDIPGEVSDRLRIGSVTVADNGVYVNTYTNGYGTTESAEFTINVT